MVEQYLMDKIVAIIQEKQDDVISGEMMEVDLATSSGTR